MCASRTSGPATKIGAMTKQQVGLAPYLSEPLYLEDRSAFLVKTKQALITTDLNGKFRASRESKQGKKTCDPKSGNHQELSQCKKNRS